MNSKNKSSSKVGVIREVKTPLGLLVLIVLVTEVILGVLVAKAKGFDFTLLVLGMLLLLGGVLFVIFKKKPSDFEGGITIESKKIETKHEVFLSSPMAGHGSDGSYRKDREDMLKLTKTLRQQCKFKSVIYAGQDIESITDFDAPDLSVRDNIEAIRESKYFVMVYPGKLVSSVLIEAGMALSEGKPSLYFVKKKDDLPFLLKQAEQAFESVKIYEYSNVDDICGLISKHGLDLLPDET